MCVKSHNELLEYLSNKLDDFEINLSDLLHTDLCDPNININYDLPREEKNVIDIVDKQIKEILDEHINNCNEETNNEDTSQLLIDNIYKCSICSETFRLEADLETHKIGHPSDGVPKCTLCNKLFNDAKILRRHVRIHLQLKPFPCNICNKSFSGTIA